MRDRDVLAEPRELPHRHLPVAPRRDADADRRRPASRPGNAARRAAHRRRAWPRSGEVPRGAAGARRSCAGCCGCGPQSGNEPELPPGIPTLGDAAARARLPRGAQGQVAPDQAAERRRVERRRHGAHRARLRLRRLGAAGRRRRREVRVRSAAATPARPGEGWDEDYTRQIEALARPGRPARAVLPRRLARQPARRARLPGPTSRRRLHGATSSPTSTCRCRRRSTRTCATSRRSRR